jgi:hypothetical protein
MDTIYFLKNRTQFIRFYFDAALKPFGDIKSAIENELPPFDDPPYSEDGEPSFLKDWMDAHSAAKILGLACVSLLSDTLKLYFQTLQHRVIGFGFKDKSAAFRHGFVAAYLGVLGPILETDWSDCPADRAVIEQIVLARNRGQHSEDFTSLQVTHDDTMLQKYPNPFFASEEERQAWSAAGEVQSTFLMPEIEVTREKLFDAVTEVEKLAEWIESRLDKAWDWRQRSQSGESG